MPQNDVYILLGIGFVAVKRLVTSRVGPSQVLSGRVYSAIMKSRLAETV